MTVHTITIAPSRAMILTANQRTHWAKRARVARHLRTIGLAAARSQLPGVRLERARIVATLTFPDRRRRDPANWAPTLKPIIDGLVDARLLPDDDAAHLVGPDLRIGAGRAAPSTVGITLAIEELP